MTTFYDILGVAPTASADDIKTAYRHLAMQFHPDKTPGANKAVQHLIEDKFKELQEAYDTLKDGARRAQYDASLELLRSEEYYQPPPQPRPPPLPAVTLSANPSTVEKGQPVTLSWTSRNATELRLELGARVSMVGLQGSEVVRLQDSATFTLTATGPGGTQSATARVTVIIGAPPQAQPKQDRRTPTGDTLSLIIVLGILGLLIWAGIAAAIGRLFSNITDGAEFASSLCLTASPFVLWICVTKVKMKWPMPALLPPLVLVLLAAATIRGGEKEIPQHPSAPVNGVRQQTSRVEARQPPAAASQQPPKRASQPNTNVPVASPAASRGVTHAPRDRTAQRLESRHPSVGELRPRERRELRPTAPTIVTANETNTDSQPGTTPRPAANVSSDLSEPERQSIESACAGARDFEGPAAYDRCLQDQLGRLAAAPRRPDLSSLSEAERQSIKSACARAKFFQGPGAYNQCLQDQLGRLAAAPRRPDLSSLSEPERQSIESACGVARDFEGPGAYNRCLQDQLGRLAAAPRRPDLSSLSEPERQSIESTCGGARDFEGPAAYNQCLQDQLGRLAAAPRRPDLSSLSGPERKSIESACAHAKFFEGPAAYNRCLVRQLAVIENHPR
ncbi:MAG: DnaJ domain-containing protein [Terriglobia bacterium]|jgi:hypothetical protein